MSSGGGQTVFDLGIDGVGPAVRLGSGGSANVYAVQEQNSGRRLAVKVLKASADTERMRKRFERERDVLMRISLDPGIVPIVGSGNTNRGEPYLLMPLMAGSLQDRLNHEGALDWHTAAHLCIQIAETVQRAHDHHVLHRDLKPANILVDDHGTTRLADFGISKLTDGTISRSSHTVGTPAYMAPEHFQGEEPDARTDVYGLGATFCALVLGRAPFTTGDNDHSAAIMNRVLNDAPPALGHLGVPAEVAALIQRAMAKTPAGRPASAQTIANELRQALGQHSSVDPDEALSITLYDIDRRQLPRPAAVAPRAENRRRRLAPMLVAAFVALGLLAGGAWALLNGDGGGGDDTEVAGTDITAPNTTSPDNSSSGTAGSGSSPVVGDPTVPAPTLSYGSDTSTAGDGSVDILADGTTTEPAGTQLPTTDPTSETTATSAAESTTSTSVVTSTQRGRNTSTTTQPVATTSTTTTTSQTVATTTTTTQPAVTTSSTTTTTTTTQPEPESEPEPEVPEAPTGVQVVDTGQSRAGNQDVLVSWNHVGPVDGFLVQRSRLGANPPPWPEDGTLLDGDARSVELINKLAIGGHRYDILVEAVLGDQVVQSFSVAFTTIVDDLPPFADDGDPGPIELPAVPDPPDVLEAPTGVSVVSTGSSRPSNEDVLVSWSHSGPVDRFSIERTRPSIPVLPSFPENGTEIGPDTRSAEMVNKLQTGGVTYQIWVVAYLGDEEMASARTTFTTQ